MVRISEVERNSSLLRMIHVCALIRYVRTLLRHDSNKRRNRPKPVMDMVVEVIE